MGTKQIMYRRDFFKNNSISYTDLMNLPDDACVKVSRSYFYFLVALSQHKKTVNQKVFAIFHKYIRIDRMLDLIYNNSGIRGYYLMSVEEIKFLMEALNNRPKQSTAFLKSDTKVSEMDKKHDDLKQLYKEKKEKQFLKETNEISNQPISCNEEDIPKFVKRKV